jgi:hypothetical protein
MKSSISLPFIFITLTLLTWRAQAAFWMETIPRQGQVPYGNVSGYQHYRNVKDFGARGMYLLLCTR